MLSSEIVPRELTCRCGRSARQDYVDQYETAALLETVSTPTGNYTIPPLTAGLYNLTVEAAGFNQKIQQAIRIQVAQTARVDVLLQVGSATGSVTVNGLNGAPNRPARGADPIGKRLVGQASACKGLQPRPARVFAPAAGFEIRSGPRVLRGLCVCFGAARVSRSLARRGGGTWGCAQPGGDANRS